jgi:hypothetical protein
MSPTGSGHGVKLNSARSGTVPIYTNLALDAVSDRWAGQLWHSKHCEDGRTIVLDFRRRLETCKQSREHRYTQGVSVLSMNLEK